MNETGAKESVKEKFITNQQILDAIMLIKKDVEEIKQRTGFNDKPVGIPEKRNYNTDPGPWQKKPETAITQ
jgi:hypothetical protein